MDQPDFAPLYEVACSELLLDQQALADLAGITKSNCADCDYLKMEQPDFSPLFVPASSSLELSAGGSKAPFASLVERAKYLF